MARCPIRIGTRGSALARVQANFIYQLLSKKFPDTVFEIHIIQTTGDISRAPISEIGGKNIFIKELEHALLVGDIDVAVHSFKDITAYPHTDLAFTGFFQNERATDAFIMFSTKDVITDSCVMATGSLRRQALGRYWYPNMIFEPIRGNIDTRIAIAKDRGYDGLILSTAGLQRLNREGEISFEPDPTQFVPAPGQGIIAIEQRQADHEISHMMAAITNSQQQHMGQFYLSLLQAIEFNCTLPLGAYVHGDQLHIFLEHARADFLTVHINDVSVAVDWLKRMSRE
jgi:hydroxymethylbilane synthase